MNNVIEAIKKSKKVGITCHVSPDGDSLGSILGMLQGLWKMGKEAYIMSKETLPYNFKYLPYCEKINDNTVSVLDKTDTVIVLDCGNVERINADLKMDKRNYTLINIDHHLSNDLYGDINCVHEKAAAVAEVVYDILKILNVPIDKDIATCLYTSLVTDTGSFKHSNTTLKTHNIAGELISTGIEFSQIHREIFENMNYSRIKLQGKVIENMKLYLKEKVCIMELTQNMLKESNSDNGDTSDIVSIGTKINTVEVTILLKESEDRIKVSLRSKDVVDVRKIAELFGGGGHIRAAGFSSDKDINEIKKILIYNIEKELM